MPSDIKGASAPCHIYKIQQPFFSAPFCFPKHADDDYESNISCAQMVKLAFTKPETRTKNHLQFKQCNRHKPPKYSRNGTVHRGDHEFELPQSSKVTREKLGG